jgi:hypothetical protein
MPDILSGSTDDIDWGSFARLPFRVTRRQAVRSQLDRAILLWFEGEIADLPAIHTLTVAVQGILTALSRDMKIPRSGIVTWIESQPPRQQKILRSPQNFFKHGRHKQKHRDQDIVTYAHEMTDLFLLDNVQTYHDLFGSSSALMVCFALKFSFEHPQALPMKVTKERLARHADVKVLSKLRKPEFVRKVLPLLTKFLAGGLT